MVLCKDQPSIPDVTGAQDPRDAGRHLLGPHVVGRRVVVRRLLRGETGPTGGPAMTDLLGVCEAWGEGRCVIRPEHGEPVVIALADIVSGKPVPPRPSVRHRVSVRDAESHTASLWASVETVPLGDWLLRTDLAPLGRLRRRANSCLAVGDPGVPFPAAVEAVTAFYADRGRPAWVHVEAGSATEEQLRGAGWVPLADPGETDLLLASVARARRTLGAVPPPDDLDLREDGPRVLARAGDRAAGAAAVDDDWLGIHGLAVEPAHRRRGLATAVTAALLEWGAERGATTAWVHVETDNPVAAAFWERLGFAAHHRMRYLEPGG